ncbi:MAG TPA: cupredoxin family copper-binding protein [Myxococcota bacterium]|nr:cupredoxin family copper-binding protein [Myxococcota bacterium]
MALAAAAAVKIENFQFTPGSLDVKAGDTVTWTNADEELHALQADDGSFRSGGLNGDATFAHTFDKPGTYAYRCTLHPQMTGKIVVH